MFLPPGCETEQLFGFAEFNWSCDEDDTPKFIKFRSNPCYRNNSGTLSGVWHDWANFIYGDDVGDHIAPAQILCMLKLTREQALMASDEFIPGEFAVVRSFEQPPKLITQSMLISSGVVSDNFYTCPLSSIKGPVAVVNQHDKDNHFFVISNKKRWLQVFHEQMDLLP